MRFCVGEIGSVILKAKTDVKIGSETFKKGQPVLHIDTTKTSTMEGQTATAYTQSNKNNTRLIAWEGEKTLISTANDYLDRLCFDFEDDASDEDTKNKTREYYIFARDIVNECYEDDVLIPCQNMWEFAKMNEDDNDECWSFDF